MSFANRYFGKGTAAFKQGDKVIGPRGRSGVVIEVWETGTRVKGFMATVKQDNGEKFFAPVGLLRKA